LSFKKVFYTKYFFSTHLLIYIFSCEVVFQEQKNCLLHGHLSPRGSTVVTCWINFSHWTTMLLKTIT
jgi:hypothetical protein